MKVDLRDTRIECEGVGMVRMAQDKGRWRAFVNTLMSFCVP